MNNIVFLLGGMDLEMQCIESILVEQSIKCYSHNLTWNNAILSAYKTELDIYGEKEGVKIYGVELRGETNLRNYTLIDHHNESQQKPSSLEQIASLLEIKLTREQMLVAANDRGYIPEMLKLGATESEINAIRRADRAMQGASDEDEHLAEESVKSHMQNEGGVTVVNSLTSRFSTICDRLFPYDNLLIYDSSTLVFYGVRRNSVLKYLLSEGLDEGVVYSGGGDFGFVGIAQGAISSEKIEEFVNKIINL